MKLVPLFSRLALIGGCLLLGCSHSETRTQSALLRETEPIGSWRLRAIASYQRGDYPRAIQLFETGKLIEPSIEEKREPYLLFYSYLATGDFPRAYETASATVKAYPFQSLSYLQLALAELWMGHTASALDHFQRASEFDAHPPRLHFYMGLAEGALKGDLARDRQFEKARLEYEQILKSNPKDFSANYELAALLLYWGQATEKAGRHLATAKDNLPQAIDEELPSDMRLYAGHYLPVLDGILLHRQGDAKQSLAILGKALLTAPSGAKPDIAEILYYMGQNQMLLGNTVEATAYLTRGLKLDPHGPFANALGRTLKANEKAPRALGSSGATGY